MFTMTALSLSLHCHNLYCGACGQLSNDSNKLHDRAGLRICGIWTLLGGKDAELLQKRRSIKEIETVFIAANLTHLLSNLKHVLS